MPSPVRRMCTSVYQIIILHLRNIVQLDALLALLASHVFRHTVGFEADSY